MNVGDIVERKDDPFEQGGARFPVLEIKGNRVVIWVYDMEPHEVEVDMDELVVLEEHAKKQ